MVAAFGTLASTAELMEPLAAPSSEDGVTGSLECVMERVQVSIITFPSCRVMMEMTF